MLFFHIFFILILFCSVIMSLFLLFLGLFCFVLRAAFLLLFVCCFHNLCFSPSVTQIFPMPIIFCFGDVNRIWIVDFLFLNSSKLSAIFYSKSVILLHSSRIKVVVHLLLHLHLFLKIICSCSILC